MLDPEAPVVPSSPISTTQATRDCSLLLETIEREIRVDEEQVQVLSSYLIQISPQEGTEYCTTSRTLEEVQVGLQERRKKKNELQERLTELFILNEITAESQQRVESPCISITPDFPSQEGGRVTGRRTFETIERYKTFARLEKIPEPGRYPGLQIECTGVQLLSFKGEVSLLLSYSMGDNDLEISTLLRWISLMIEKNRGPTDRHSRVPQCQKLIRCIRNLRGSLAPKYRVVVSLPPIIRDHPLGTLKFNRHGNFSLERERLQCFSEEGRSRRALPTNHFHSLSIELQQEILLWTLEVFSIGSFFSRRLVCRSWNEIIEETIEYPSKLATALVSRGCIRGVGDDGRMGEIQYPTMWSLIRAPNLRAAALSTLLKEEGRKILRPIEMYLPRANPRIMRETMPSTCRKAVLSPDLRVLTFSEVETIVFSPRSVPPRRYSVLFLLDPSSIKEISPGVCTVDLKNSLTHPVSVWDSIRTIQHLVLLPTP